jgi:ATP-dependent helicase/nuclease subunit B
MLNATLLKISNRDTSSQSRFAPGETVWNEHRGGPETLLRWLETQLGLLSETVPLSSRVIEFAGVVDACVDACYTKSLKTDRWSTATELLARRDELRMAGWNELDAPGLPPLVRDLALAAQGRGLTWPDMSLRLTAVLGALEAGQVLPPHRLMLDEPIARWPARWRPVLKRLNVELAQDASALGQVGSMLRVAQLGVLCEERDDLAIDPTLRWVSSCSTFTACEFVATVLAAHPERLSRTVVYCEDASAALCLDGCLARLGLPTMGASLESLSHPVFQVLPLVLNLMWQPVDPELLLAFLSLSVSPLPRHATWRLAAALAKQPGLGSGAWTLAYETLCEEDQDAEKSLREKLANWLNCNRYPKGSAIPATAVTDVCGRVAQWATGYASFYADKADVPASLIDALRSVAGQAATLGQLSETHGGALSEPQIARLRDASMSFGGNMVPYPMAASGPRLVTSLADIRTACSHLIWLGQSSGDASNCRWSAMELSALRRAGIELDDGTVEVAILRDAERRGFCNVTDALLAISLPGDAERKTHPFWVQIRNSLPKQRDGVARPVLLEDLLTQNRLADVAPWQFETAMLDPKPCQPRRAGWHVPAGLLQDREESSASELADRLACPLKWVLNYQARIYPSAIASLPDSFQLKGLFCHRVLELVLGDGGALPDAETAVRSVGLAFDERLPLDAAPLAQPMKIVDRQRLRDSLCAATRVLVNALQAGGYRIHGIEVEVTGSVHGRKLIGSIDCLAIRDDGQEAVIDFKFGGRKKYDALIREDRAVQLATYAFGRAQQAAVGNRFPAVAYLVIDDARLLSGERDRLVGASDAEGIPAAGIAAVWKKFEDSLAGAEEWLSHRGPVPARPLQPPEQWPAGAHLVLSDPATNGSKADVQEVCKYCHYPALCGIKELI